MSSPAPKTITVIIIDFVIGALAGDVMVALGMYKFVGWHGHLEEWTARSFGISMLATTLIAGSICAMFRNEIWADVGTYSVIPPVEEKLSRNCKIVLWTFFALGLLSLSLFFIPVERCFSGLL